MILLLGDGCIRWASMRASSNQHDQGVVQMKVSVFDTFILRTCSFHSLWCAIYTATDIAAYVWKHMYLLLSNPSITRSNDCSLDCAWKYCQNPPAKNKCKSYFHNLVALNISQCNAYYASSGFHHFSPHSILHSLLLRMK